MIKAWLFKFFYILFQFDWFDFQIRSIHYLSAKFNNIPTRNHPLFYHVTFSKLHEKTIAKIRGSIIFGVADEATPFFMA